MRHVEFDMEAGKYWIGDPCYVLSDDRYDKLIEAYVEGEDGYQTTVDGQTVTVLHTQFGDGTYYSNLGDVDVDSGQVAAVPMALVDTSKYGFTSGHVADLPAGKALNFAEGTLCFSEAYVDTQADIDDENEDESGAYF